MLLHPRVVRGALVGDVESDIDVVRPRRIDQPTEVGEGPQFRVNLRVPALGGADAPRAANVSGLGLRGIVLALAECPADRMDRREIEYVEPHPGDPRQLGLNVPEGAVLTRLR